MTDVKVAVHIFLAVLVLGTLWRISSFHLMASQNVHLQHVGKAMTVQY